MQKPPSEKKPGAVSRPSFAELYAMGKSLREKCPRSSHAGWKAPDNRVDPLRLLEQDNKGRIPQLIPIRYGRMVRTPFTFYRGAARNMAADLARTPASGLRVHACGDAHLLNFGAYATPERRLVFDINDMRHSPHPGNGTSSASRPASSWRAATTASAQATRAMRCWRVCARTGNAWRNTATTRPATWRRHSSGRWERQHRHPRRAARPPDRRCVR
jgi:hypothetical protein